PGPSADLRSIAQPSVSKAGKSLQSARSSYLCMIGRTDATPEQAGVVRQFRERRTGSTPAPLHRGATAAEQSAMVGQTVTTALTNYAVVLNELQSVAPEAQVFLLGYYNSFPSAIAPVQHAFYDLVLGAFNPGLQG